MDFLQVEQRRMYFRNLEDAKVFEIQCRLDGNEIINTSYDECGGIILSYYEISPKKKVDYMTVQEVIVSNNICDFSLSFKNVLDIPIENPNPNVLTGLIVKSISIDWLCQTATITIITR